MQRKTIIFLENICVVGLHHIYQVENVTKLNRNVNVITVSFKQILFLQKLIEKKSNKSSKTVPTNLTKIVSTNRLKICSNKLS